MSNTSLLRINPALVNNFRARLSGPNAQTFEELCAGDARGAVAQLSEEQLAELKKLCDETEAS